MSAASALDRANALERGAATAFDPGLPLAVLGQADATTPNDARTLVPLLQGLILAGHFDQAIAKAHHMAQTNPGAPFAHLLEGDALMAKRQYALAASAYGYANSLASDQSTVLRLVYALAHTGDGRSASYVVEQFRATHPANLPGLALGSAGSMASGRWALATDALEQQRRQTGNGDASLLTNLAWAWFNRGDVLRALSYGRTAYALQPGNANSASTYGLILLQSGKDRSQGLALLEKAASAAPNKPAFRLQLAEAYVMLGRKAAARELLGHL